MQNVTLIGGKVTNDSTNRVLELSVITTDGTTEHTATVEIKYDSGKGFIEIEGGKVKGFSNITVTGDIVYSSN